MSSKLYDAAASMRDAIGAAGVNMDRRQVQVIMPPADMDRLSDKYGLEASKGVFELLRLQFGTTPAMRFACDDLWFRRGRFSVQDKMLRADPVAFATLFSQVIVVGCDVRYWGPELQYFALSPFFDPIEQGVLPPVYVPVITRTGPAGGVPVFVRWEREA